MVETRAKLGIEFLCFFSSRRRHTRCLSDWSSDVCSSDLVETPVSQRSPPRRIQFFKRQQPAHTQPVPDFHRVRRTACRQAAVAKFQQGRKVRGYGRLGELSGQNLGSLHLPTPGKEN